MFATDCAGIVTARLYFCGKERKDVPIRSVKEAAETFRYSDSAILCKGAMGQAEFDNNYSEDTTCHLKHSVDIVYGIVLSRSCSGIVSKEGPGKQPWLPNDRSKVCSLHFRPEDYRESTKYRRLKPDAAPTLFPDFPTYLQPAPSQPRRPAKRKRVSLDCPKQATKHRQEQFLCRKLLHKTQESQGAFKLVRCLTEKHLSPSNFEKMNVRRAVDIFSVQVTSVLRFLQQHGHRLGANGFQNCLPTLEFMEVVQKWFALHNIKSTTLHWTSRDALRMPFYSADDERLLWLETECLQYFAQWKESTLHKKEFLSEETYEALRVTTLSTVLCTRHLLQLGFYFVLTGKFSSDDVESLFSAIRQLNGSNDLTDAYAALSALQKILTTGIIHSSESGNVGGVVAPLGEVPALPVEPVKQAATGTDIRKLLLPHLATLERYPCMCTIITQLELKHKIK
ncbi:hypothetical protein MRX96_016207 [Rhipicephalus microplus]